MGKKVLIVGYPKSGNTWVGYMLAYILGAKYIDLHAPNRKPTRRKWVLDLIQGNLPHSSQYDTVAKSHALPNAVKDLQDYDKVIHLVRDPRDVAVSYYFYQYYNLPITRERSQDLISLKPWPVQYILWKRTVLKVAKEWSFHTIAWRAQSPFMVRYEDLHKDAVLEMNRILKHLEHDCDNQLLDQAIQLFSFERLSGGREPGKEDPYHFFRKGVVGDYKNYFGFVDKLIIRRYAGEVMRRMGYKP